MMLQTGIYEKSVNRFWAISCATIWIVFSTPDNASGATNRPETNAVYVNSTLLNVEFRIAPPGPVVIYVTPDDGDSWRLVKTAESPGPVSIDVAEDGRWGLFLMPFIGDTPPQSPPSGTAPQKTIHVDTSPPVVQIGGVRHSSGFGRPLVLTVHLSFYDENLGDRPLDLFYRKTGEEAWIEIARDRPATTRYAWNPPDDLEGPVEIRIVVADRAENRTSRSYGPAPIPRTRRPAPPSKVRMESPKLAHDQDPALPRPSDRLDSKALSSSLTDARRHIDQARFFRRNGSASMAEHHLGQALKENPDLGVARLELAQIMLERGRYGDAQREFSAAFKLDGPVASDAALGLALTNLRQQRYQQATNFLDRWLRDNPDNARAWLMQGDALANIGRRERAREAWRKAAAVDPSSRMTAEKARRRLSIYGVTIPKTER
jgi:tetratricopeptide (TPR) repeat protein